MHSSISLLLVALTSVALAQTPVGFSPQVDSQLEVLFNSTAVDSPGTILAKAGMRAPFSRLGGEG
jgi:phosphatidylethanolamine-binding protein